MRTYWGLYDYCAQEIKIDFRSALVPTLIHECIHHWHPEWSETEVLQEEKRIVNSITPKQALNLMKLFFSLFK